ncbi:MAG TPA: zinc ribbon domain-containing protein [Pyrinomonadaceae bacterium]|nr:zinc ribbon domain-containing protein [Pyrinomonadaceae bacterium]
MPIYEYRCKKCGAHLEKRQSISEAPLTECESCGGELEKQWSLSGFQFKGAGWYVTDYAGKTSGNGDKAEKTSGSESTASTEVASKSKSDTPASAGSDTKSSAE